MSGPGPPLVQLRPWAVIGIPLLCWLVLLQFHRALPGDEALAMTQGWRLVTAAAAPPDPETRGWEPVALTDDWWRTLPQARQAWYRFELDLEVAPDRLWAIYLPRAAVNAAVWLNGEPIGSGGRMTPPIGINWSRPLYFLIPNGLLQPGRNELQVQLVSDLAGNGLLRPFFLGSDAALAPYHQWRYFIDVTAVEIITVFMVTMGAFMGALWWLRRDPVYGWFAESILVWALHHLGLLFTSPPLPPPVWWWLWYATLGWAVIGTVFFVSRFLEIRRPRVERGMLWGAAAGTALLGIAASQGGDWLRMAGNHGWDSFAMLLGVYATALVLHAWRRGKDREVSWLITSGLLVFGFGIHDWLVVNGLIPRDDGLYLQYSPPLVLMIFGWILLMRFVGALTFAEALNRDLEARVSEQVAAAEAQHRQIRRLERVQLLAEERERLMRDMHDGLGGHMVSTLALIEGARPTLDEVGQALHAALDDLRLVVNSLDPHLDDLATALRDLRARLDPRLQAAGIRMEWQIGDLPSTAELGPDRVLQILRIVQEAITNILKHAHATRVVLEAELHGDAPSARRIALRINDNGVGFNGADSNGKGLASMQRRAQSIGAALAIDSVPGATTITLGLTLPPIDHTAVEALN